MTALTPEKKDLFFPKQKVKQLLDIKVFMRNVSHMLLRKKTGFVTLYEEEQWTLN